MRKGGHDGGGCQCYLYLTSELSRQAEQRPERAPHWIAPLLWRSEFAILASYLRKEILAPDRAYALQTEAEALLAGAEQEVLTLVRECECHGAGL